MLVVSSGKNDECITLLEIVHLGCIPDVIFKKTSYITPDGDGINDVLRFSDASTLVNSEIYIYNRWGDEIYRGQDYQNNWNADGYPDGVYYYVLMYNGQQYKSTVTVVR